MEFEIDEHRLIVRSELERYGWSQDPAGIYPLRVFPKCRNFRIFVWTTFDDFVRIGTSCFDFFQNLSRWRGQNSCIGIYGGNFRCHLARLRVQVQVSAQFAFVFYSCIKGKPDKRKDGGSVIITGKATARWLALVDHSSLPVYNSRQWVNKYSS